MKVKTLTYNHSFNKSLGPTTRTIRLKEGEIEYTTLIESTVTCPLSYYSEGLLINIAQYKSITFPHKITPGSILCINVPINYSYGYGNLVAFQEPISSISIKYDGLGKLIGISLPKPISNYSPNNYGPAVSIFENKACILPMTCQHLNELINLVNANEGTVEFRNNINIESTSSPHIMEPPISVSDDSGSYDTGTQEYNCYSALLFCCYDFWCTF